jgi:subtilisin family serine protease
MIVATGGHDGPLAPILDGTVGEDGLAVSIRFVSDDIGRWAAELDKIGVVVHRDAEGAPVCVGEVCGAFVPYDALAALDGTQGVVRVEAGWVALSRRPLFSTVGEIGGLLAHARDGGSELTGEGIIIGNLDEPIDLFHPAFLQADGGYFDWIDTDGDGAFSAGDAIDFDTDGSAGAAEAVTVLDGSRFWADLEEVHEENRDEIFQSDQDWVYFDANDNGHRDYGAEDGFFERDPGYGEQLFIHDDVNQDGVVDDDEKFMALASSKLMGLVWGDQRFLRGNDLIYADSREELRGDDGPLSTSHGTAVGGILAGGTPNRSRFVGVAPDAELVSLVRREEVVGDPLITVMNAAETLEVDVLLFEFSSWNFTALDGSTNAEAAAVTLRNSGMAQVNPAGNLGVSNKHGFFRIEPAGTDIAINVPRTVTDEGEDYDVGAVLISLHWDDAAAGPPPSLELVSPGGDVLALDGSAEDGVVWFSQHVVFDTPDRTPNGTRTRFIFVGSEDGQRPMRSGDYTVRADAEGAAFDMHVFVDDYYSGWGEGVGLYETDPATTICWPATGDAAFGVGAYGGFQEQAWDGDGSLRGELRNYSSRGPRMDGATGIDIVAPDDPLSPIPAGELVRGSYAWYGRFGGTSGAGPHVAGALALLRQVYPSATVPELEQHLIDHTLRDLGDDLPSPNSGWGKLRIFETMEPSLREGNAAPVIDVVAVESNEVALDVRGTVDEDRDEVVYVVDLGYDGETDFGPSPGPFLQIDAPQGDYIAVVYAYDGRGGRDGTIVHGFVGDVEAELDAGPPPAPDPEDVGDTTAEAGAADVGLDAGDDGGGSGGCECSAGHRGSPAAAFLALVAFMWRRRR